jgi:hypothetical protein
VQYIIIHAVEFIYLLQKQSYVNILNTQTDIIGFKLNTTLMLPLVAPYIGT